LRDAVRAVAVGWALLVPTGCALPQWMGFPPRVSECPGLLVPTAEIPGDFVLRQRLRVTSPEVDTGLDLAVQKHEDELVVVGFTALGAKAFSITQRGTKVRVRDNLGRASSVPPINVLRDLHRVLFLSVRDEPFYANTTQAVRDGTRITEFWWQGHLTSRIFQRMDEKPAGTLSISFPDGGDGEARIHNVWCNYDAVLVTVSDSRR
jgi:hypothetical protein